MSCDARLARVIEASTEQNARLLRVRDTVGAVKDRLYGAPNGRCWPKNEPAARER